MIIHDTLSTHDSLRLLRPLDGGNDVEYLVEYLVVLHIHRRSYFLFGIVDIADMVYELQITLRDMKVVCWV